MTLLPSQQMSSCTCQELPWFLPKCFLFCQVITPAGIRPAPMCGLVPAQEEKESEAFRLGNIFFLQWKPRLLFFSISVYTIGVKKHTSLHRVIFRIKWESAGKAWAQSWAHYKYQRPISSSCYCYFWCLVSVLFCFGYFFHTAIRTIFPQIKTWLRDIFASVCSPVSKE